MTHRYRYHISFTALALLGALVLYLILANTTSWPWFPCWIISAGVVAFVYFGLDKSLSKIGRTRVPELVLHLLSVMGGFIGALLGMLVFRHKSNFKAHPLFLPVMLLSAGLWGLIAYWLFWR